MDSLEKIRDEIDEIDRELLRLFEKRMEKVSAALEIKQKLNLAILQEDREKFLLEKIKKEVTNKNFLQESEDLFRCILQISRNMQKRLLPSKKIAYQGERGSFGEQALLKYLNENLTNNFNEKYEPTNFKTFAEIFKALKENEIKYGILPIENSYAGGVYEVYDLLNEYNFFITGEIYTQVEHCLIGTKEANIEDIKEVYSHPQAILQCNEFLMDHDDWLVLPYYNTAGSAKMIAEENEQRKACIASKEAAKIYELKVLAENIQTKSDNFTRFIIIGRDLEIKDKANKISLIFSLTHKSGALYESLGIFALNGLNLLKIESRPTKNKPWEYNFYVDLEGNLNDYKVKRTLDIIKEKSNSFKLLGNY